LNQTLEAGLDGLNPIAWHATTEVAPGRLELLTWGSGRDRLRLGLFREFLAGWVSNHRDMQDLRLGQAKSGLQVPMPGQRQ
jgi:hypothetical protein